MKFVRKRDGRLEPFDQERITNAIWKAAKAVGGKDREPAKKLSDKVLAELKKRFGEDGVPTVEEIQDIVEKMLIEDGHARTAKAYILYRKQHQDLRELAALLSSADLVDQYLEIEDWRVRENSNMSYSLQGLNNYLSSTVIAKYWITRIYPSNIAEAHFSGDIHIHNLGVLGPYCVGWDLRDLLLSGFGGVSGKIESKPAKHFRTALGQIVNFFYTLQGEAAGAQAFSNFDTYLSTFIRYDGLNQKEVEQALQEFFFNMNVPTRVGFQTPFTNVTLDLTVPEFMKNEPVVFGGKMMDITYGSMQAEMEMFNMAFADVMSQGDSKSRVFTFPIPTYNITKDFGWDSPIAQKIFEVTAKYGVPYFSNFINTDMKPEDVRSMCLHPDEELIVQNDGEISRVSIEDMVSRYAGEFDEDGWAFPKRSVSTLSINPKNLNVEWQQITGFLKSENDELVQIVTEDGKIIRVTPNHPIPIVGPNGLELKLAREVKPMDIMLSLRSGKKILNSKYKEIKISRKGRFKFLDSQLREVHDLQLSDLEIAKVFGVHKDTVGRRRRALGLKSNPRKHINEEEISRLREQTKQSERLVLDEGLGAFLGFFTAEGNYLFESRRNLSTYGAPKGIQLTFHGRNVKLRRQIKKLINVIFRVKPRERRDSRYDVFYFYIRNVDVARALYQAGFKKYGRLPDILFSSPPSVIEAFLDYFFLGDGYEKRREIHINDEDLARDLVILNSLLGRPTCYKNKGDSQRIHLQHNELKGGGKTSNPTIYELLPGWMAKSTYLVPGLSKKRMVGIKTLEKYGALTDEARKFAYNAGAPVRVMSVRKIKLQEPQPFYDLELKANHLFIHTLGTITHNCCRLRIDNRELRKRGGGLFGANPLTGCYDEKTEILTEDGWKLFKDLTKEDKVFTLTEDNTIDLHKPTKLFEYDHDGEMYHFKTKSLDLLVTPNHRMVIDQVQSKKRKFIEAKDFDPNNQRIPKQSVWKGKEKRWFILPGIEFTKYGRQGRTPYQVSRLALKIKMDDWLKFFGFWLAEGSTDSENVAKDHGYRVIITQLDEEKREEFKKVMDALPFNYNIENGINFVICNKQLWTYMKQFRNAYTKFIPKDIKQLSRRQLKILFDWMMKGNGHVRKNTGQINYWTASEKLAGDLQETILKLGWLGTLAVQKKKVSQIKEREVKAGTIYTIGVQKATHYRLRENNIKIVDYKGKVYCCEVKNHTVFVRRNGKVCWCGNSIGVVTLNMPRIGYLAKDEDEFFERLETLMEIAKDSLEIKRKGLENFTENGLYPYSRRYLRQVKEGFGRYWKNHFSTIGLIGMNEAVLNLLGCNIALPDGKAFAVKVLSFMREKLLDFQEETGNIYNLEATPAEGTSYRLARIDKRRYPDIIVANEKNVAKGAEPFYTNSSQLPVDHEGDLFEALEHQESLQTLYTGGTVFHIYLGERLYSWESAAEIIKKVAWNSHLPYFTLTPTFSICQTHGYINGEQKQCPTCGAKCEVYSRVVGYLRPVDQWNDGKQAEFAIRRAFDKSVVLATATPIPA